MIILWFVILWFAIGWISGMILNVVDRNKNDDFYLYNLFKRCFLYMMLGFIIPITVFVFFIMNKFQDITLIKGRRDV